MSSQDGHLISCHLITGHVRRTLLYLNQQVPPNENFGQEPIVQFIIRVCVCAWVLTMNACAPCRNTKCMRQTLTRIAALVSVSVMSGLRAALPIGKGLLPLRTVGF